MVASIWTQHHFLLPRIKSIMKITELCPPPLIYHGPSSTVMTVDPALFTLLPTEAERIIIRGKLEAATAMLATVESKQAPLLAEKTRLEEVIPVYKSLLSALRLLPTNVLGMIFIEVVSTPAGFLDDHGNRPHTLDTKYGAFGLSQVCRRWREVALNMPQLWSCIVGDTCISLSRYLQLGGIRPLFAQLAAHSDRWESLYVFVHQLRFEGEALNQLRGQLSSLRRLSIRFLDPIEAFGYLDAFETVPALSHLRLRNIDIVRNSMVFPWRHLTRFHIEDVRNGEFGAMLCDLERMTSLQYLVIDNIDIQAPSTIFSLPSVTSLTIRNSIWVLEYLTLPNLPKSHSGREASDLLERSHCDLKSLTLSGKTFGENVEAAISLISPFALLSQLVWLCPSTDMDVSALLRRLTLTHNELDPRKSNQHLESFIFQMPKVSEAHQLSLVASLFGMLNSRVGRGLQEIILLEEENGVLKQPDSFIQWLALRQRYETEPHLQPYTMEIRHRY
ncbi:hypothetical protein C8J56DRAFT_1165766 [Mycena floridula]|nr:hypothetical protein C8J56DRAFT_1165766 [Mycena floridula]